jgi:ATP-dependent helicase HrpB
MQQKIYSNQIDMLPVTPYLDEICTTLKSSASHFLVLTAETAAGKSTAVPLALLNHFPQKILMLEPRRIATIAVTTRVAQLLGEKPGDTAGFMMHLESCISARTRFEVMTEAILTRMLQTDPLLDGVSVVVLDEFHERSIHADLALAFLKEAIALRDDLYVMVMSATVDTDTVAAYLGTEEEPAPVFKVPGRQFPVHIEYAGNILPSDAVRRELADHPEDNGRMLVFLPGIGDIRRTAAELSAVRINADVCILHSTVSFDEQKRLLEPYVAGEKKRIILSSAIAETSLTIPGITVVVDSGLARVNRMNVAAGMETLVTEPESVFSAAQRAGRAGRTAPGRCICLWNRSEQRTNRTLPEIVRTDLTALVLECAQWGVTDPKKLSWLDQPPDAAWNSALSLLTAMECIASDRSGMLHITSVGKAALTLGLHPRLACAALAGLGNGGSGINSALQCVLRYSTYGDAAPFLQKKFCSDLAQRLQKCAAQFPELHTLLSDMPVNTHALLAGYPDRIALLKDGSGMYQFPSGRVASLPRDERQNLSGFSTYIVAPDAVAGEREGHIYRYEPIADNDAISWLTMHAAIRTETKFVEGTHTIRKTEERCYGKIVLSSRKIEVSTADFSDAVCTAVEKKGLAFLPMSVRISEFLLRAQFYEQQHASVHKNRASVPELCASVHVWLPPFLTGTEITSGAVYEALRYYLDGETVDRAVPEQIKLVNGRQFRLTYEQQQMSGCRNMPDASVIVIRPVLEIIIQQIFGCFETPCVMGIPVLLKLLSPARRPLQITSDLAGFWQNTWPEICREMKGRYPKHNWDYRVAEKE